LRDKPPAGFSIYKSTTSLRSTVKGKNTIMTMLFCGDHAEKSVLSTTKLRYGQTSSRYKLLQLAGKWLLREGNN
jgi:hypothetical protein